MPLRHRSHRRPADSVPESEVIVPPAAILTAWRIAERRYAAAAPGTEEAASLREEMRLLMDEYEWRVRGSVPRRVPSGAGRRR
jgi:hypothetical protein